MNPMSRRSMMKLLGAGALAAATPFGLSRQALAAGREKNLNILCWEGYNSADVLDPYRKLRGADVKAESATNDPTMINRLRAGENKIWDLINVNNPWARKILWPEHLIKPLDRAKFEPYFDKMLPIFKPPYSWAMSDDGQDLLGMVQRFGPFNFVVNTDKISRKMAEQEGWDLWNDKAMNGRYGIQESDDWNVFDIFLIAGIDPFKMHTDAELQTFSETAVKVFKGAKLVGDVAAMNQALVTGEIDCYLSGGTYTASLARAEGYDNIRAISPLKGAVMWVEVTSLVNNPTPSPLAEDFLAYVQQPQVARQVAFAEGTYNPVAQMGNPECLKLFSKDDLNAIQWDSLEEEMSRSMAYDIVPDYEKAHDLMTEAKRQR
ncbi:PotD/PotF family extracellular solute-binding protein [Pseudaeromonas sp. ZJS20]|uniref:ABC transporter substrate-binding protein n=1 Tax=Pseudaeromonas aegiceratis TaxID=3153928 RepID=UPI00390CCD7C